MKHGDCEGPLGIPMLSESAKEVESVIKNLNSDCKEMIENGPCRFVSSNPSEMVIEPRMRKSKDAEPRTEISLVTSEAVDRDSEIILAGGADWRQYTKNPVVVFGHDYSLPPVGRALWINRNEKGSSGWVAKSKYAERPDGFQGEWFPDTVWYLIEAGMLPAKSIGFIPMNMREPKEKEILNDPKFAKAKRVVDKWVALEYSVVTIPSNPDALVQSIGKAQQKGLTISDAVLRSFEAQGVIIPRAVEVRATPIIEPRVRTRGDVRRSLMGELSKRL